MTFLREKDCNGSLFEEVDNEAGPAVGRTMLESRGGPDLPNHLQGAACRGDRYAESNVPLWISIWRGKEELTRSVKNLRSQPIDRGYRPESRKVVRRRNVAGPIVMIGEV